MSQPPESINTIVARNLAARNTKNLSTPALAKLAGISQKTVWNILHPAEEAPLRKTGTAPSITLRALESLCAALGTDVWEILAPMTPDETMLLRAYRNLEDHGAREAVLRAANVDTSKIPVIDLTKTRTSLSFAGRRSTAAKPPKAEGRKH